jgi:DNA (cytosine-5)-methyltransferase 1
LKRAQKNPLFFGAKAKLEWQAGQTDHPDIWNQIFQLRPSGIRVKVNSYFPALVAIVQTSIIGSRRRFLTPRECARLQSFPEDFQPDVKQAQAYKQFGNAVNVGIVKYFAKLMFGKSIDLG